MLLSDSPDGYLFNASFIKQHRPTITDQYVIIH